MSLDIPAVAAEPTLEQKNAQLQAEIAALRKQQRASLKEMDEVKKEKAVLLAKMQGQSGAKSGEKSDKKVGEPKRRSKRVSGAGV